MRTIHYRSIYRWGLPALLLLFATLFQKEAACRQLKTLFKAYPHFNITDYGIRDRISGKIVTKEEALRIMDLMVETAQAIAAKVT